MRRPVWILFGPGLGAVFAVCQFALLLGPVRDALRNDLGISVSGMAIVVLVYLAAVAGGFAAGFLLGRRAPTSLALAGLGLMLLGGVLMAFSGPAVLVGLAGLTAGLGGGAVLGTAAALTGQVEQRWRGQSRLALGLAAGGGLVLGIGFGWMVSSMLGWRWAYLAGVPVILVVLAVTGAAGAVAMSRRQA